MRFVGDFRRIVVIFIEKIHEIIVFCVILDIFRQILLKIYEKSSETSRLSHHKSFSFSFYFTIYNLWSRYLFFLVIFFHYFPYNFYFFFTIYGLVILYFLKFFLSFPHHKKCLN